MTLRQLGLALAFTLALSGCADRTPTDDAVVDFDRHTLRASLEPASARVGGNSIFFSVQGADGRPVDGAELDARVHMHAMGTMPAMGGMASVSPLGDGRYRADFQLDMAGSWLVEVRVRTPDAAELLADGSLTVGTSGLSLGVRAGQAGPGRNEARSRSDPGHPARVSVDPQRLQRTGVRTATVAMKPLSSSIRAVGRIRYDETSLRDVSVKVRGWIGELEANAVGMRVRRGGTLFTLYSPELFSAQEEYLQSLRSQQAAKATSAPERADYLVRAARRRLALWDIAAHDIDAIARSGHAREYIPVRAPASGFVIQKNVVEGSAVGAGDLLFRIAPLDTVWVEADVYESELPHVAVGQQASVSLPDRADASIAGTVSFIYPYLENRSRTARVRVELANPDLSLRPDMYVNVSLHSERPEGVVVPQSGVLHAGERSYVFIALGEGRFEPREVELGARNGEEIEVRSGLSAGERIVISGTFLIASESRLRAALEDW